MQQFQTFGMAFADRGGPFGLWEVVMTQMPAIPLWDVLYLDGISLVISGCIALLMDEGWSIPDAWSKLPPLLEPYAEI
jgi:hypothetical protein